MLYVSHFKFVHSTGEEISLKKKSSEQISRESECGKKEYLRAPYSYSPKCSEEVCTRYFLKKMSISCPENSLKTIVQQINPHWEVGVHFNTLLCCCSLCLRNIFGSLLILWIAWVSAFIILGMEHLVSWKGVCENCFSVGLQTAAVAGCAVHGEMEAFGNGHEKDT